MSIRRRNIQTRLSRDLELEREAHQKTRALLDARIASLTKALDEQATIKRQRDRLLDLAGELSSYFSCDPPAPLSRATDLFLLLKEVAPLSIRSLPLTAAEKFQEIIEFVQPYVEHVADLGDFTKGLK